MDNSEQEYYKAQEAKQLLENPLLREAFAELESDIIQTIKESPAYGDDDMAMRRVLFLQLLGKLKEVFEGYIKDGEIAEYNLKERGFFNKSGI